MVDAVQAVPCSWAGVLDTDALASGPPFLWLMRPRHCEVLLTGIERLRGSKDDEQRDESLEDQEIAEAPAPSLGINDGASGNWGSKLLNCVTRQ